VLITGASAGIGAELARELARRGHSVVLVARRADRLADLAAELTREHAVAAEVEAVDLADAAARDALVERLHASGRAIVGVCNNAGFGSVGRFDRQPLERETEMVRLNVEALHALTGAFLPGMVERGAGAVLNVASIAAAQPLPTMATYAATKAFVVSFSEAVHTELHGTGVSVTALCPGFTRTEFGEVAGGGEATRRLPELAYADPAPVARAGVEAMVAGRRASTPGLLNKALATSGRLLPRSVLLPAARLVQ
jgi:short-subunit dehydrogenase